MKKFFFIFFSLFLLNVVLPMVQAHCPLCTAATGVAVATTRVYGLDDLLVGIFIGAFVFSTSLWFNNSLLKKNKGKNYFPLQIWIILLISFIVTILTYHFAGLLGNYKLFGLDRLVLGTIAGGVLMQTGSSLSKLLKKVNNNKVFFPFQSIVLPFLLLIIASLIVFFLHL